MAGDMSLSYESTFHFPICPFVIYVFSYESFVSFSLSCLSIFSNSTFLFLVFSFVNESFITMSLSAFPFINVSQNHMSVRPHVILMLVCKSSFVSSVFLWIIFVQVFFLRVCFLHVRMSPCTLSYVSVFVHVIYMFVWLHLSLFHPFIFIIFLFSYMSLSIYL